MRNSNYIFPTYYAFGSSIAEMQYTSDTAKRYRYGFNGKETDSETDLQDYGYRIYNPNLGRFLSVDPLFVEYSELSVYQFASNTPIQAIDLDGLEAAFVRDFNNKKIVVNRMADAYSISQYNTTGGIHHIYMMYKGIGSRGRIIGAIELAIKYQSVRKVAYGATLAAAFNGGGEGTLAGLFQSKIISLSDVWTKADDIGNTFRHFVWQVVTASLLGSNFAKDVGEMHERERSDNKESDMSVDLLNNEYARQYAQKNNIDMGKVLLTIDTYTAFLNQIAIHIMSSNEDMKNDPGLADYISGKKSVFTSSDESVKKSYQTVESIYNQIKYPDEPIPEG